MQPFQEKLPSTECVDYYTTLPTKHIRTHRSKIQLRTTWQRSRATPPWRLPPHRRSLIFRLTTLPGSPPAGERARSRN